MRFKTLSKFRRSEPFRHVLDKLPQTISMAEYARAKAFKISELVRDTFKESYEWYGFTLADRAHPEFIIDIGLPENDMNLRDHTTLGATRIAEFHDALPKDRIINGWIHSHGALNYKHFSTTDEKNNRTVLDFVAAGTRRPLAKIEIPVQDLVLLEKGRFAEKDLENGTVSLITDKPITQAMILETVYGSFSYSIIIGDTGWHIEKIYFRERGALSGRASESSLTADIQFIDTGRALNPEEIQALAKEVGAKIQPNLNPPTELIERM